MSGFKVGDDVVIVNRDRGAKIESIHRSEHGDAYYVRFDDGQLLFYREKELGLKSDFAKDRQLATLRCVRKLLLSDEFLDDVAKRMNEKFCATEFRSVTFGTVDLSNADDNTGVAKCQIQ
jgi:hypothetical protein